MLTQQFPKPPEIPSALSQKHPSACSGVRAPSASSEARPTFIGHALLANEIREQKVEVELEWRSQSFQVLKAGVPCKSP